MPLQHKFDTFYTALLLLDVRAGARACRHEQKYDKRDSIVALNFVYLYIHNGKYYHNGALNKIQDVFV